LPEIILSLQKTHRWGQPRLRRKKGTINGFMRDYPVVNKGIGFRV